MGKILAAYGGGFKPPTGGHFEIVKRALQDFPEIDEFTIFVGGKVRDGIEQEEAVLVWDIYKNYLANKVKIEPVKSPIGEILRLAKNNPQDLIYFVIGYREGRQDDLDDVAARTGDLEKKYPNIVVKVIPTYDPNMSGTNARAALVKSEKEFIKFLPPEVKEKSEIYAILRPPVEEIIKEDITKSQLDSIEKYADGLFNRLGIDIEFTRHFLDRVNDKRNDKPISVAELIGMFKRLYKKHGKPLSKVDDDFNAVVKDFNNNINIPFAINVTDDDIEMYAKTVMRKKDFKTSTPVIALNENATYTSYIDLQNNLIEFTKHMIRMGLNITPLPSVEFIDGDSENASKFLGRTAYYDPNTNTIVLYTEGRHPKDIARSFAHEMIHHIQNLEGRIGNIQTTNTNEDEDLDAIEREAYQEGNMIFRNWTDSLDGDITTSVEEGGSLIPIKIKKPKPDPFGLNAYARELAMGLEEAFINEGKYDSLVTKLAGFTLNAWKGDFKDGQSKGYFELEVGPGREFDYPHLFFNYKAKASFVDDFRSAGVARPMKKMPEVELNYRIPLDELPRMWEQISMDIRNTIRHEIEHLMQSGPNTKQGKEKAPDYREREELKTGKKPWWKIWRKTLGTPDYYKLEKEVDANLEGLYLKAKKSRTPLKQVIDNYVKYTLNLPADEQEEVKRIWAERAPKLNIPLEEGRKKKKDPKKGTGKKPEGSSRRLYTDEDPKDTVGVKFSTRQDIVNTLNKKSFKARSHARQSQIINLIHQRVRAALARTKDPKKKAKLQSGFKYIKKRKEASKAKTQRLKKQKQKNENIDPKSQSKHKGKSAPFGSAYEPVDEKKGFGGRSRYRAIEKRGDKYYFIQDNPFAPGIRQEFGPYKTKAAAKRKMGTFPPTPSYRDITEYVDKLIDEKLCKRGYNYIAKRKRQGEKHNPFLTARAVKVCKGQMSGTDGKQKKDFRPKKGKKRSAQGRKPDIIKEIGIDLSNYSGQVLPGDILRAPKGFPLGGKKLEKSLQLKVIKNSREGVNRYKLSLEDKNGKKYSVRNYEMDGEYKGEKLPKWGLIRKSKKNITEQQTYKIFSDMDGVLTDFDTRFKKYSDGIAPSDYEKQYGKEKFWELADGPGVAFWVGMPWMEDGKKYWDYIKNYDVELLSSPSRSQTSRLGKRLWVRNNMPGVKLTLAQARNKQNYAAPNHILIDDRKSNIDQWKAQGGIGILHTSADDTINQLKKLGL